MGMGRASASRTTTVTGVAIPCNVCVRSCSSLRRGTRRVTRVGLVSRSLVTGSHAISLVRVCVSRYSGTVRTIRCLGRHLATTGVNFRMGSVKIDSGS